MTLLQEYQALPGEPELDVVDMLSELEFLDLQVTRRDAVIRLLAKALRKYGIDPHIDGRCGCDECNAQAELRALLTAVERDFPEGA